MPSVGTLVSIARVLGVTTDLILEGTDEGEGADEGEGEQEEASEAPRASEAAA